jgi:predicted SAM-dependent methyltransferase
MSINEIKNYDRKLTKINLGCGFDIRPGYLNVDSNDFHNPDLVADIQNLSMLSSDFYEEIVAQDCLEHLLRTNTRAVLQEWYRLLGEGGILKLRVPDVLRLVRLFKDDSMQNMVEQENLVQCMFGTQAYNGDFHYTGFTPKIL